MNSDHLMRLRKEACLSRWFHGLGLSGVPVPATRIITTDLPLHDALEGEPIPGFSAFVAELRAAAEEVGGYPCFLRTGHGSGKHAWGDTCFVPDAASIGSHVQALVEWSAMVDIIGLPTRVWAVREFLHLASTFTARRMGGFPVNRERRYFIAEGEVLCHHPYWPEGAVGAGEPTDPTWREKLALLNEESPLEVAFLTEQSERVASQFKRSDEAWSLDWALDIDGIWWAIDMAPAALSYHWPGCSR